MSATRNDPGTDSGRIVAVDFLRGLVLLLLIPDTLGAFSFYRMARLFPDHPIWPALASQFTHVEWNGAAVWDLVMPLFVFLVGVSMAISHRRRQEANVSEREMLGVAALRSATLVVLGLLLQLKITSYLDEALLFAVLATGLPISTLARRAAGRNVGPSMARTSTVATILVLVCAAAWMAVGYRKLGNYDLSQILILIGLSYLPAFFMMRYRDGLKAAVAAAVVAVYGLAFVLYVPRTGITPHVGLRGRIEAHWSRGDNLGSAVDHWFLNLLPRGEPYAGNPHDYYTLQFVPLIAVVLAGAIAGGRIIEGSAGDRLPLRFAIAGFGGLAVSWMLSAAGVPLVKSLWTPTWTVFSMSVSLILLAVALLLFRQGRHSALAVPLVILGSNSILLYVLTMGERWRVVSLWEHLLPAQLMSVSWRPVLESLLVLGSLWVLAAVLYRWRVFVRI